eukprot:TRINITY_DN3245_c0_g2_i4.p2 TRINITY_DN3245_c0_g2~~TRINITY_DN3245_c0_g2_i4.p2  ORF type:complete len:228 (+),score=13.11 TRINITY_DN3245_c0_g2_i4:238-921(+)
MCLLRSGSDFTSGTIPDKFSAQVLEAGSTSRYCDTGITNLNANGVFLYGETKAVDSESACCERCNYNEYCNTWVFCPNTGGCGLDNPNGAAKYGQCDLKFQGSIASGGSIQYYERGFSTRFTSGSIPSKSFSGKCIITTNANYDGYHLSATTAKSSQECCDKCKSYSGCNVFVYCDKFSGCRNVDEIIPYGQCDLKYQTEVQNYQDPTVYNTGKDVDFTSGLVPRRG